MIERPSLSYIPSLLIGAAVTLLILFGVYRLANSYVEKGVGYKYQQFRNEAVDGCMKEARSVVANVFNESLYKLCLIDKGFGPSAKK